MDISPPVPVPAPVAEITEPRIDIPCRTEEPVEIEESFTASPAWPGVAPVVLEAPLESPSGPDQEFSGDLTESPDVEMDPETCPADVSNWLQSIPAEPDGPEAEPEDKPTDDCVNPSPEPPEVPREANLSFLYPTEGPDCANSQRDTPQSEDYKSCQPPRHEMDRLSCCSRI